MKNPWPLLCHLDAFAAPNVDDDAKLPLYVFCCRCVRLSVASLLSTRICLSSASKFRDSQRARRTAIKLGSENSEVDRSNMFEAAGDGGMEQKRGFGYVVWRGNRRAFRRFAPSPPRPSRAPAPLRLSFDPPHSPSGLDGSIFLGLDL